MKRLLPFLIISLCGCLQVFATVEEDEALVAKDIEALHDAHDEVREKAAAQLRGVIARYPSGTSDLRHKDSGEAMWKEKLAKIKVGMTWADVMKLLEIPGEWSEEVVPEYETPHRAYVYQLGLHWNVTLDWVLPNGLRDVNTAEDQIKREGILEKPPEELSENEFDVWVPVGAHFTGKWTLWYVNGQKALEEDYKDGLRDGISVHFISNGRKGYAEHFHNNVPQHVTMLPPPLNEPNPLP